MLLEYVVAFIVFGHSNAFTSKVLLDGRRYLPVVNQQCCIVGSNKHIGHKHRVILYVAAAQVGKPRNLIEHCNKHTVSTLCLKNFAQTGNLAA